MSRTKRHEAGKKLRTSLTTPEDRIEDSVTMTSTEHAKEGQSMSANDTVAPEATTEPVQETPPVRVLRTGGASILEGHELSVSFGGLAANNGVSLAVRANLVTGLIGPNGAGKTTCFNVLTGALVPHAGRVMVDGVETTGEGARHMAHRGVARTFQNLELFEDLTVRENVELGATRFADYGVLAGILRTPRARRQDRYIYQRAEEALEFVGIAAIADVNVADLPYGLRRRTEIARALALGPRVLLLDEPTAGMDPVETGQIGELLTRIVEDLETPVLLVEHDMSLVQGYVDYVYVLEFGQIIAQGTPIEVLRHEDVIRAYFGATPTR